MEPMNQGAYEPKSLWEDISHRRWDGRVVADGGTSSQRRLNLLKPSYVWHRPNGWLSSQSSRLT